MKTWLRSLSLLGCALVGVAAAVWLATSSEEGAVADALLERLPTDWAAELRPRLELWSQKSPPTAFTAPTTAIAQVEPLPAVERTAAIPLRPQEPVTQPYLGQLSDEAMLVMVRMMDRMLSHEREKTPPPASHAAQQGPTPPATALSDAALPKTALPNAAPTLSAAAPPVVPPPVPGELGEPLPNPFREDPAARTNGRVVASPVGEGDGALSLYFNNTDIREALKMISEQAGLNILPTNSVEGVVSASLPNVDINVALEAILRSKGYVARREGDIIYVGTPADFESQERTMQRIATRLYRPNYVRAADLQQLVTPMLTPGLGFISVNQTAKQGIPADGTGAGGDDYALGEVLLVRDLENVLNQVDLIVREIDCQPLQVAIEAMVLSVKLQDKNAFGVDFGLLRDSNHLRIISGVPPTDINQITGGDGGLKVGFLDASVSLFLEALETIGTTNVIATPKVLCLNKQRAEILIGRQLGYVSTTQTETSTTQAVEFLEVGTQLRIRPFISADGMVRMEVHPEVSTGQVRVEEGFTLPDKDVTTVTTNIIARDGSTVVIGGLIREELKNNSTQIPLLGSLPWIGPAFRQTTEDIAREELLVLITPRIVSQSSLAVAGEDGAMEFHHRQAVVFDHMNPLGQRHISQQYFLRAQEAWAAGDQRRALHLVDLAIHFNPQSRKAIDLRADIFHGQMVGDHTVGAEFRRPLPPPAVRGEPLKPWMIEEIPLSPPPAAAPSSVEYVLPQAATR